MLGKKQSVFFRCDASYRIGQGHLMRCLVLAKELQQKHRCHPVFIMGQSEDDFKKMVQSAGFVQYDLSSQDYDNLEIEEIVALFRKESNGESICIIDHYSIDAGYESALRGAGIMVINIDDQANRSFCSDMIVNYHFGATNLEYVNQVSSCQYLLGPQFSLLSGQFEDVHADITDEVLNVLFTFGSGEAANQVSLKFLECIRTQRTLSADIKITIVGSAHKESLQKIINFKNRMDVEVDVLTRVDNMAEVIAQIDIAVCGGGVTAYEIASCGVPMLMIQMADNQKYVIEGLKTNGAAECIGRYENLEISGCFEQLQNLIKDGQKRREMSLRGPKIIDGKGAQRVASEISNLAVTKV